MKKLMVVLMVATALTGCVNHAPSAPIAEQSDNDLCKSGGYATATHDGDKLIAVQHELTNRIQRNSISITKEDCQILAEQGAYMAEQDAQANQVVVDSMQQQMQDYQHPPQQAYQPRQQTTQCHQSPLGFNSMAGSITCTTF